MQKAPAFLKHVQVTKNPRYEVEFFPKVTRLHLNDVLYKHGHSLLDMEPDSGLQDKGLKMRKTTEIYSIKRVSMFGVHKTAPLKAFELGPALKGQALVLKSALPSGQI